MKKWRLSKPSFLIGGNFKIVWFWQNLLFWVSKGLRFLTSCFLWFYFLIPFCLICNSFNFITKYIFVDSRIKLLLLSSFWNSVQGFLVFSWQWIHKSYWNLMVGFYFNDDQACANLVHIVLILNDYDSDWSCWQTCSVFALFRNLIIYVSLYFSLYFSVMIFLLLLISLFVEGRAHCFSAIGRSVHN